MADLSVLRARLAARKRLAAFFAAHPEIDEETQRAIRKADDEYDPAGYLWSTAEVWAAHPGTCRACYEPRVDGLAGLHLFRSCGRDECGCAHHAGEVWVG